MMITIRGMLGLFCIPYLWKTKEPQHPLYYTFPGSSRLWGSAGSPARPSPRSLPRSMCIIIIIITIVIINIIIIIIISSSR